MNTILLILIGLAVFLTVFYFFYPVYNGRLHVKDYSSYSDEKLINLYCKMPVNDGNFYRLWFELNKRHILYQAQNQKDKEAVYGKMLNNKKNKKWKQL